MLYIKYKPFLIRTYSESNVPKILNGNYISAEIRNEMKVMLAARRSPLMPYHYNKPRLPSIPPTLAVVLCSDDPASRVYVKKKVEACVEVGINSFVLQPFENGIKNWSDPREHLIKTIDCLNSDINVHGILIQLPLPKELNVSNYEIFDRIDPLKDVDVFNPVNTGLLLQGRPRFIPCTPHGIQELLTRSGVKIDGKKVAIINRSDVVGKPLKALLIQDKEEANATVTICHDRTPPQLLQDVCQSADIIVVAVGKPNFITPNMVNKTTVLVDVGINRVDGKIVGDVRSDVYDIVAAYSPVPGGVGPMTVTMLLHNTMEAQKLQYHISQSPNTVHGGVNAGLF